MKIDSNDMPTPKDLAKKETTRPISLRIKEKTMLEFEKYAQMYNTTASSLINELLGSYIDIQNKKNEDNTEYHQLSKKAAHRVMSQYLEKLSARVGTANDEDLCYSLANDAEYSNIESINSNTYYCDVIKTRDDASFHYEDDYAVISVFMGDDRMTEFMCVHQNECAWVSEDTDELHIIGVPASKYPIVGNMILGYTKKYDNLYPGQKLKIDSTTTEKMIIAINSTTDRTELAKKVGQVLASYEEIQHE